MSEKKKTEEKGITVKKEKNFNEWYTQAFQKADLADYTLVSGCVVFKPYAHTIWDKIREETKKRLNKMDVGEAYFPLFIPEKLLEKEAEHVEGFSPEVAWVEKAGNTKLGERLAVRPTSEAIMYDSYSKWIRSHRDLPLKMCQWNNVVRWEFKNPVPFLRSREFLWVEGHTVFADEKGALDEDKSIMDMWQDICENYLALKGLRGKKSENEKFAGAVFTKSIEYRLPNGKIAQGPDFHYDGQNFAKAYSIKFIDEDEKEKFVFQNTWAISTRMLGVLIAVHGDDQGLILPPKIAPYQVVIIPIIFDKHKKELFKETDKLKQKLEKKGFRVKTDKRENYKPGWKFNQWEMKGVPLRIELGPRELEKKIVTVVRRDNGKKENVNIKNLGKKIKELLDDIQKQLLKRSEEKLKNSIKEVKNIKELENAVNKGKIGYAKWCNNVECEENLKDKTTGIKSLNMPEDKIGKAKGKCAFCDKEAKVYAYFGKTY
ncbi:proline--tRNA ligase [Candidatus Woesearchaeota archaeon]|nr:proline--tRNA ligase [Candidatus Woesearchaeota archaeon]